MPFRAQLPSLIAVGLASGTLLYRIAKRTLILDVTRVLWLPRSTASHPAPCQTGASFRFLTEEEVYDFSQVAGNGIDPSFVDRIHGGRDLCFAATVAGDLAAYIWLALDSIEAEQNRAENPRTGVAISFPSDTAFVYKAFTHPKFRGRGLFPACLVGALLALEFHGIANLLSTTDWSNQSALAGFRRVGFRDLGPLWRFGCRAKMFTWAPRVARKLGVKFGSDARVIGTDSRAETRGDTELLSDRV